ncbi:MAG: hypothetical protein HYU97_02870 [Deltaproteobacteria bacterium]|nr:hypothetical protein [Deltaproteobacteria bacterium]
MAENPNCFVEVTLDLQEEAIKGTSTQSVTHWAFDREGQLYPRSDAGVACVPSEYSDSGEYVGKFEARPVPSFGAPIQNYYGAYEFAQPLEPAKIAAVRGALQTLGYLSSSHSDSPVVDDTLIVALKEADRKTPEVGDQVSLKLNDEAFVGTIIWTGTLSLIIRNEQNELLILRKRGDEYQAISKESVAYNYDRSEFVRIFASAKKIINDEAATTLLIVEDFQEIPKK